MRAWIYGIVVLFCVAPAWAQVVSVRTGEHDNFTRLVFSIPLGSDWQAGRIKNGFAVIIPDAVALDDTGAFDRIPRTRVLGLNWSTDDDRIDITADCDCHLSAFLWRPDRLVVDILDGPGDTDRFDVLLDDDNDALALPIVMEIERENPLLWPLVVADQKQTQSDDVMSVLENQVASGLARAATQGLLDAATTFPTRTPREAEGASNQTEVGLLAHTSMDFGVNLDQPEDVHTTCIPFDDVDVAYWGGDAPFSAHIAALKDKVTGEFDSPDPTAVENLARGYLFYGFGREAINALQIDGEKSQARSTLVALATIIDGDPPRDWFMGQTHCAGPTAVWAVLEQDITADDDIDRNAVIRNFKALPTHLQTHLGPKISAKFLSIGDLEAAEILLSASRSAQPDDPAADMLAAEISTSQGDAAAAIDMLGRISVDDRATPETLLAYFTLALAENLPINPETLELAHILRFENKDQEIANDLAAAQAEAMIKMGDVAAALDLLHVEKTNLGPSRYVALYAMSVSAAVDSFADTSLLDLAFSVVPHDIDATTQNKLAARLVDMGLPDRALEFLAESAVGQAMIERRFLRAAAEIARGDGQAALTEIMGQTTPRAMTLRRQAQMEIDQTFGADVEGEIAEWRMGNWANLLQSDDTILREVSVSMLASEPETPDAARPLAQGRRLLEQSLQSRQMVEDVLQKFGPIGAD